MQSIAPRPMIAVAGISRSGKDTVVNAAVAYIRDRLADYQPGRAFQTVVKRSFFSSGKDAAYEIFKCYGLQRWEFYDLEENQHLRDTVLPACGLTPVQIWIGFGDKVRAIHQPCFADRAVYDLPEGEFSVFTSLRFPEEAAAVRKTGGWCVRVDRVPSPPPRALDKKIPPDFKWDRVIVNDGSIADLEAKARSLVDDYLKWYEEQA